MSRVRRAAGGDDGQVLVLSLAYALLALLLVTAVASATSIHLERKRLLALADLAALDAADALDEAAYYGRDDDGDLVVLSDATVEASVEATLAASPAAARLEDLRVAEASTPDGRTALVRLTAVARPPLVSVVTQAWSDGVALTATARAAAG